MNNDLTLPDFIVISPAKSATNTVFNCLQEHPSICMAKNVKGTRFFDRFYHKGIEWYAKFFKDCPDHSLKGEVVETYFYTPNVPERIYRHIPSVKFFICLRNPIERAFSLYLEFKKFGFVSGTFEQALDKHRKVFIEDNFYYDHMVRYFQYFPQKNIFVTLFDDFKKDRSAFIQNLYAFLEIDDSFVPESMHVKMNPARRPRFRIINRMAFHMGWFFRKLNCLSLIAVAKKSNFAKNILFRQEYGDDYPEITPDVRKRLQDVFQNQIENLANLIERDLSVWR